MKKLIGILGIAVIAMTMFFSTNSINTSDGEVDLASLIAINTANAETVIFGCKNGGTYCGGHTNCKSVIIAIGSGVRKC